MSHWFKYEFHYLKIDTSTMSYQYYPQLHIHAYGKIPNNNYVFVCQF